MKKIYDASTDVHASLLKDILEDRGIKAVVQEARLLPLRGKLPALSPTVWVADEDVDRAREIAAEFDRGGPGRQRGGAPNAAGEPGKQEEGAWTCPSCGEENGPQFSECWKCVGQAQSDRQSEEEQDGWLAAKGRILLTLLVVTVLLVACFLIIASYRRGGRSPPVEPHGEAERQTPRGLDR
jgi:hypothetical protein